MRHVVKLAGAALVIAYAAFLFGGCAPEPTGSPVCYGGLDDDPRCHPDQYRVSPGGHGSLYIGIHGGK